MNAWDKYTVMRKEQPVLISKHYLIKWESCMLFLIPKPAPLMRSSSLPMKQLVYYVMSCRGKASLKYLKLFVIFIKFEAEHHAGKSQVS